jgi:hypothetical protein
MEVAQPQMLQSNRVRKRKVQDNSPAKRMLKSESLYTTTATYLHSYMFLTCFWYCEAEQIRLSLFVSKVNLSNQLIFNEVKKRCPGIGIEVSFSSMANI